MPGEDDTVRLWDADAGTHLITLTDHTADVYAVTFTPDGSMLTSGAWDASIRSWDPATGAHLKTITGHTDAVAERYFQCRWHHPRHTELGTKPSGLWDATTGSNSAIH